MLTKAGQNERVKHIANRTSPFVAPRESGVGAFSLTNNMLSGNVRHASLDNAKRAVIPHQTSACARSSASVRCSALSVV